MRDVMLETERLILRPPIAGDFEPWAAMLADEEAARFIGGVQTTAGAWRAMAVMVGAWHLNGFSNFSVIKKSNGAWIGRVGPWQPTDWPGPEIGRALSRSAWGNGYATEAAARTIDWVISELDWDRVIHIIHPENKASIAVAERLGSVLIEGVDTSGIAADTRPLLYGRQLDDWHMQAPPSA